MSETGELEGVFEQQTEPMRSVYPGRQPDRQTDPSNSFAQLLFIVCLKRAINQLVETVEIKLEATAKDRSRIFSYGIMQKTFDGYLVVLCYGGFPAEFVAWLLEKADVEEYVIIDLLGEGGMQQ